MGNTEELWGKILDLLQQKLTSTTINTFFDETVPVEFQDNTLVLDTGSDLKKGVIEAHYQSYVEDCLMTLFSVPMKVSLLAGEAEVASYRENKAANTLFLASAEFTFDTFVVGNSNRFAHAAAAAVAKAPAAAYNPLFIHGGSGLGKTHLLYAIAHEIRKSHPAYRIAYIKGDDFTNELISAIRAGKNVEFRDKYRNADLFLVDDIQFIAGKEATQEEFFHTFNTLYEAKKQIVLTSDRPPKEMTRLEDRLQSRFEWGLISDIQPPDYETRVVIIRNKASSLGIKLDDDTVDFIAENITANVRQIEGTVKKIRAFRDLLHMSVDMDTVSRAVQDVFKENPGSNPTPDMIIEETSRYYSTDKEELLSSKRGKQTVLARHMAIYLIRTMTKASLQDIGKIFGRHHSTIMHSVELIEGMLDDTKVAADIAEITSNIRNK
ncbi:chromosomal replication initiator protein DnaA [Oscillospiraceae bacterium OttesenSCG-928-F05]|nr:chromosomal replication initiator protein DnaA [Oscillospiraceae bacterium OttesenSCG-928-F05]